MPLVVISTAEFSRLHATRPPMLDVRTPAEFHSLHVEGAENLPLTELDVASLQASLRARGLGEADTLYLLCQSGKRAEMAAQRIAAESSWQVAVVEGGTLACVQAGLPTKRGQRQVMSLERQVRVVAGSLVLTGAVLGFTVAPGWHYLSGFVGGGLLFAGLSDTCMMGMLLARMPWNQA